MPLCVPLNMKALGLCVVLSCVSLASGFVPAGNRLLLRGALNQAKPETIARNHPHLVTACTSSNNDQRPHAKTLDRRSVLGAVPALVLGGSIASAPANAFPVPAAVVQQSKASGPVETDMFIQHAVLEVEDLNAEVAFWTKGLGMKVLRKRAGTVFVGYGPESIDAENGGHFALELTENEDAARGSETMQRIELQLQYNPALLVDAEDYGGKILPRWFGTANFVEVASPAGFVSRISYTDKGAPSPYPVKAVVQKVPDVAKAKKFFNDGLLFPKAGGFQLPFIGDGSASLQLRGQGGQAAVGVALVLEAIPKDAPKPRGAESLWKLAVVTSKRGELAKASEAAGGKVLFDGTAPGTSTKVTLVEAAESALKVALVDVEGFKAEIPTAPSLPPPPPPAK